jgi:hypothetical protein
MNCKPGDMAIVVSGGPRINLGRIVRCVELLAGETCSCGGAVWLVDGDLESPNPIAGLFAALFGMKPGVGDCCLKPIRDPGDDAVDEMLEKIGAPAGLVGMPADEVTS